MRAPGPGFAGWAGRAALGRCVAVLLAAQACMSAGQRSARSEAPPSAVPHVLSGYNAPLGCPTEPEYVQEVSRRSVSVRLQSESPGVSGVDRVRVRIQPDSSSAGWVGSLWIEGAHPLEREVRGERCRDVALALALITVLRLESREAARATTGDVALANAAPAGESKVAAGSESERTTQARVPSQGSPGAASPASVSAVPAPSAAAVVDAAVTPTLEPPGAVPAGVTPGAADTPAALPDGRSDIGGPLAGTARAPSEIQPSAGRAPEGALALREREQTSADRAAAEPPTSSPSHTSGGELVPRLAAHVGFASAPSQALQAQLQAELQFGPGIQSWLASLGVAYSGSGQPGSDVELSFRLITAQLSLCAPGTEWAGIWLRGCAALAAGPLRITVTGRDASLDTQATTRAWFAVGPSLQAGLPLSMHWSLRALLSGSALLVRDRLDVERVVGGEPGQPDRVDRSTSYRAPLFAADALLGLGYAF